MKPFLKLAKITKRRTGRNIPVKFSNYLHEIRTVEALAAMLAFVWRFSSVNLFMSNQTGFRCQTHRTVLAVEAQIGIMFRLKVEIIVD